VTTDPKTAPRVAGKLPALAPETVLHLNESSLIPGDRETLAAWKIAFFGAIALLVALPIYRPHPFLEILSFVPDGLTAPFTVPVASVCCALVLGLLAGLGRIARTTIINRIATVYVEVVRGIPLLVQLFYIYFVFPEIGIQLSAFEAGVIGLGFAYSCYMAEVFRNL